MQRIIRSWYCLGCHYNLLLSGDITESVYKKKCGMEKRLIVCSSGAIPDKHLGWICDCGRWVKGYDRLHIPVECVV